MARIRTIKPDFFVNHKLWKAEKEARLPLRLAFEGLWCHADREGRFKWVPEELKIGILPYDNVDFSRVLDALWTRGYIEKYESNGEFFGVIPSFLEHQVINNREKDSVLPIPNKNNMLTPLPRDGDASSTREPRVPQGKEGKGKEGKGNGKTTIPKDFSLSNGLIKYANSKGVTDITYLQNYTDQFIQSCEQHEYKYANFEAAWKKWFPDHLAEHPPPKKPKEFGT